MPGRRLTDHDAAEIRQLRGQGWEVGRIAAHLDLSDKTVSTFVIEHRLVCSVDNLAQSRQWPDQVRSGGIRVKRFRPEEDDLILDMWRKGATFAEIRTRTGRSYSSIRTRIKYLEYAQHANAAGTSMVGSDKRERKYKVYEYNGQKLTFGEWSRRLGISLSTLLYRYDSKWEPKDVLNPEKYARSRRLLAEQTPKPKRGRGRPRKYLRSGQKADEAL